MIQLSLPQQRQRNYTRKCKKGRARNGLSSISNNQRTEPQQKTGEQFENGPTGDFKLCIIQCIRCVSRP